MRNGYRRKHVRWIDNGCRWGDRHAIDSEIAAETFTNGRRELVIADRGEVDAVGRKIA